MFIGAGESKKVTGNCVPSQSRSCPLPLAGHVIPEVSTGIFHSHHCPYPTTWNMEILTVPRDVKA